MYSLDISDGLKAYFLNHPNGSEAFDTLTTRDLGELFKTTIANIPWANQNPELFEKTIQAMEKAVLKGSFNPRQIKTISRLGRQNLGTLSKNCHIKVYPDHAGVHSIPRLLLYTNVGYTKQLIENPEAPLETVYLPTLENDETLSTFHFFLETGKLPDHVSDGELLKLSRAADAYEIEELQKVVLERYSQRFLLANTDIDAALTGAYAISQPHVFESFLGICFKTLKHHFFIGKEGAYTDVHCHTPHSEYSENTFKILEWLAKEENQQNFPVRFVVRSFYVKEGSERLLDICKNYIREIDLTEETNDEACEQISLREMPLLENIYGVDCSNLTDAGIAHLGGMPTLRKLEFETLRNVQGHGFSGLTQLTTLAFCDPDDKRAYVTDTFAESFGHLTRLEKLSFESYNQVTTAGLRHLTALQNLRDLELHKFESLLVEDTEVIAQLPRLERLSLYDNEDIKKNALIGLRPLENLRALHLSSCRLESAHIQEVGQLTQLEDLTLNMNDVTDDNIVHLRSLIRLQKLSLEYCEDLTDAALQTLSSMTTLRSLDIGANEHFTDTGLRSLAALTQLQELRAMWCPEITENGENELQGALPHLRIVGKRADTLDDDLAKLFPADL